MKNLSFISLALLCALTIALTSCQKETIVEPTPTPVEAADIQASHLPEGVVGEYYTPSAADFATPRSGNFTVVPGGSVDALEAAIANTADGGVVYLEAGTHTLNSRLMITKSVKLIGEDGASLSLFTVADGTVVDPGIHILGTSNVLIKNIEFAGNNNPGWTALLVENTPNAAILDCTFNGFIVPILVEDSDQIAIIGNQILNPLNIGILQNNGKSAYIANNYFEGAGQQGIWACDMWGTLEGNTFNDNRVGAFLCNFPAEFGFTLPSGEELNALSTSIGWKIRNNRFDNTNGSGLILRDATRWALVETNNSFSNNELYDILIPDDEDTFIFIPAAIQNTIFATPDVLIKDCGKETAIFGGTLVDTTQDPC